MATQLIAIGGTGNCEIWLQYNDVNLHVTAIQVVNPDQPHLKVTITNPQGQTQTFQVPATDTTPRLFNIPNNYLTLVPDPAGGASMPDGWSWEFLT